MDRHNQDKLSIGFRLFSATSIGLLCISVFYGITAMNPSSAPLSQPFFWEQTIPFLEWMVVPYLSLFFLFFLAFLLCADKTEIAVLCKQATLVIAIAAISYVLFPVKFSFDKPAITGLTGNIISFFQLDYPYTQFPSLHTALGLIVWQVFNNHCKPQYRKWVLMWFCLLITSNVFIYQHHIMDIVGGVLTAALALYFFPGRTEIPANRQSISLQHVVVGLTFLFPALSLLLLGGLLQGWFTLLIYPGICLTLVANAYFRGKSNFSQKQNGQFPWWTHVLFFPYLVAIKSYWRLQSHSIRPWIRINSGIIIGRRLATDEWPSANDLGITTVLDLSPEISDNKIPQGIDYIYMPLLDHVPPSPQDLQRICQKISDSYLEGTIFVQCNLGNDRCLAVLTAYLAAQNHDLVQSLEIVQKFKPNLDLPAYYIKSLLQFANPMKESHLLEREASSSHRALT